MPTIKKIIISSAMIFGGMVCAMPALAAVSVSPSTVYVNVTGGQGALSCGVTSNLASIAVFDNSVGGVLTNTSLSVCGSGAVSWFTSDAGSSLLTTSSLVSGHTYTAILGRKSNLSQPGCSDISDTAASCIAALTSDSDTFLSSEVITVSTQGGGSGGDGTIGFGIASSSSTIVGILSGGGGLVAQIALAVALGLVALLCLGFLFNELNLWIYDGKTFR
jgi:hypothetical protein